MPEPRILTFRNRKYEDAPEYDDKRFALTGDRYGIAWRIFGWEIEPNEDTDWTGDYDRTGRVLAVMVGDDAPHYFDPSDLTEIDPESYCPVCGQIGCPHGRL